MSYHNSTLLDKSLQYVTMLKHNCMTSNKGLIWKTLDVSKDVSKLRWPNLISWWILIPKQNNISLKNAYMKNCLGLSIKWKQYKNDPVHSQSYWQLKLNQLQDTPPNYCKQTELMTGRLGEGAGFLIVQIDKKCNRRCIDSAR